MVLYVIWLRVRLHRSLHPMRSNASKSHCPLQIAARAAGSRWVLLAEEQCGKAARHAPALLASP